MASVFATLPRFVTRRAAAKSMRFRHARKADGIDTVCQNAGIIRPTADTTELRASENTAEAWRAPFDLHQPVVGASEF